MLTGVRCQACLRDEKKPPSGRRDWVAVEEWKEGKVAIESGGPGNIPASFLQQCASKRGDSLLLLYQVHVADLHSPTMEERHYCPSSNVFAPTMKTMSLPGSCI
ncbi:hypothetical protein Mp_6g14100 [Marchantia polymorpha subsp. ruderalis]|uniref:Uncharacterized protein n=2 Tax=Marchantia polymorpha TaxID=3197 RepID=A0AAF6BRV7_MARPO|nr:hypothetical protein MARPO_0047s0064 [Marchantia polymorpha]BBN14741.1 hypothetical protein Mp_6g14100 [Marchantia polymorpha subsp. ruderalis]|eukprot:PTQ39084.1 hypothetical protein MARPO_0047s0064 [Marchantia polymorpha]